VQTHPEENMRCKVMVIELTEKQESYLVHPELEGDLFEEGVYKELITTIDRHGNVSLWPIRLESPDGQLDDWSRSAAAAALSAQTQWTRIVSNRQLGAYEIFTATGDLPPPQWPDKSFEELCEIAFPDDRRIHTLEHPAVRQLRGEE
jgi:hypothetical protein